MATDRTKKPYGKMPCEGQSCKSHESKQVVVVMKNGNGTLSYRCDWCGRTPHALPGTGQYAEWETEMEKFQAQNAQPAASSAENEAAAAAAPARKQIGTTGWPLYEPIYADEAAA